MYYFCEFFHLFQVNGLAGRGGRHLSLTIYFTSKLDISQTNHLIEKWFQQSNNILKPIQWYPTQWGTRQKKNSTTLYYVGELPLKKYFPKFYSTVLLQNIVSIFMPNISFIAPGVFELGCGQTDRQTDMAKL